MAEAGTPTISNIRKAGMYLKRALKAEEQGEGKAAIDQWLDKALKAETAAIEAGESWPE